MIRPSKVSRVTRPPCSRYVPCCLPECPYPLAEPGAYTGGAVAAARVRGPRGDEKVQSFTESGEAMRTRWFKGFLALRSAVASVIEPLEGRRLLSSGPA